MYNPLAHKLENFVRLSADDRMTLDRLARTNMRSARSRADIFREGDDAKFPILVLQGWACRYKVLEDGRRQNTAILLPGDICDPHIHLLRRMDHSIGTFTSVDYVQFDSDAIEKLMADHPRVLQALLWDALVSASIQREWTVNLGQRSALERVAHLICELYVRLAAVGMRVNRAFDVPLTQVELAATTGLTPVHVNRTIQEMRARELICWQGRRLEVLNCEALSAIAMFDPSYLHLRREGSHLDANDGGSLVAV